MQNKLAVPYDDKIYYWPPHTLIFSGERYLQWSGKSTYSPIKTCASFGGWWSWSTSYGEYIEFIRLFGWEWLAGLKQYKRRLERLGFTIIYESFDDVQKRRKMHCLPVHNWEGDVVYGD